MTPDSTHAQMLTLERELASMSRELTEPRERECLTCYIYRMLEFGCSGPRWAARYRDLRAPRVAGLERRLSDMGACCCDCEIFLNAYTYRQQHMVLEPLTGDYEFPDPPPDCLGARRGSTRPCGLWVRRPRGRFY